ncbi:MAG: ATP-binding protein, partial [Planctomycetota bacterium]
VRNAIQASPSGGEVTLALALRGEWIALEVRDRGPGVPPEAAAAIFEPFHSGRPDGAGLGLPLALAAAQAHAGTIEVEEAPGGGALFRIKIPAGEQPE